MKTNDVVLQFLIVDELEKMGVMPMLSSKMSMRNDIDRLDPEEARKMKRKFRKVWRKRLEKIFGKNIDVSICGKGAAEPSRAAKNDRRRLVFDHAVARANFRLLKMKKA